MCAAHVTASDRRHRRRCCCATVDRRWVARKAGMFCTATAKVQQELTHELTRAEAADTRNQDAPAIPACVQA